MPDSYAYILQADLLSEQRDEAIQLIADSDRDVIVLDAFFNPGQGGRYTLEEIQKIKQAHHDRTVLCYLSIGEAEDYRPYWQTTWTKSKESPDNLNQPVFLLEENPDWEGNYKVQYWTVEWQSIILKEVETIAAQGFDGLWLDIVDAYQFFEHVDDGYEDNRVNPETGKTFRRDMIDWVRKIAAAFRANIENGIMFPQNGSQLLEHDDYVSIVDGIALEDLFTTGKKRQNRSHTADVLKHVAVMRKHGKPVLLTEYPETRDMRRLVLQKWAETDFVLLLAERDLGTMGTCVSPKKTE